MAMLREQLLTPTSTDTDEYEHTVVLVRLQAKGFRTATGFASCYDDQFPDRLEGIVSHKLFHACTKLINQTVQDYYPCLPCYCTGYLCCLASLGLSRFLPEPCTHDLEMNLDLLLRRLNTREEFLYRGIVWTFKRPKCSRTSWIEISQVIYA